MDRRYWWAARLRPIRLIFGAIALALVFGGSQVPLLKALDGFILDFRFQHAPRDASGNLVFLAIDKQTLDRVGIWPWPRSQYALLLDKLSALGVADVFIDVDFSTPSTPAEDDRLSAALSDAGGGTILPVFNQFASSNGQATTVVTQPLESFASNAWLAFANAALDDDGAVRRFAFGDSFDGHQTQSVAAVLGRSLINRGSAPIDYSISPATVPTISLADLFRPGFDGTRLKGRSVVVGAYATELKDVFPVPVYGQLPGPMLHILAAETIAQQRLLKEPDQRFPELAFAALILAAALTSRRIPLAATLVGGVALIILLEATAFVLQRDFAIILYTAKLWFLIAFGLALALTEKVDFSRFLADLANAEQRNIRRLLRKIVADSTDAVLAFDHRFRIFEASDSSGLMLSGESSDYKGRRLTDVIPPVLCDMVYRLAADHERQPNSVQNGVERFSLTVNETVRHLEAIITISPLERPQADNLNQAGAFIGSLMIRDTTSRQLYEERLQYLSSHDDLTGLMNRRAFIEYLEKGADEVYVAAVGLHRFSVINETIGRHVGDDLLRGVARRLQEDSKILIASRLGGDVFAVAIPTVLFENMEICAQAVVDLFDVPIEVADNRTHLTVRVGICALDRTEQAAVAIEQAEHALDMTKNIAGGGWRAYEPEAAARQHQARILEASMRDSLQNEEFFLVYQPQVNLKTGALSGAEALLRWQHPQLGLVSPASFIPVAEANGFICDLGRWAFKTACVEASRWPEHLAVAVNVAPLQILQSDLVADVKHALQHSNLKASRLTLEVTESALAGDVEAVVDVLSELRSFGCRIALDDFGTGYSSLSYISDLPLDKLKIDQSFVKKLASDTQSLAIVKTIRTLAQSLHLEVVAEGIESRDDWSLLSQMDCEQGQGYFFGKPLAAENLLDMVHNEPWVEAA